MSLAAAGTAPAIQRLRAAEPNPLRAVIDRELGRFRARSSSVGARRHGGGNFVNADPFTIMHMRMS
jgi:hypothetical protein